MYKTIKDNIFVDIHMENITWIKPTTNLLKDHSIFYLSLPYAYCKGVPVVTFYPSSKILNFVPCRPVPSCPNIKIRLPFHDQRSSIYNIIRLMISLNPISLFDSRDLTSTGTSHGHIFFNVPNLKVAYALIQSS